MSIGGISTVQSQGDPLPTPGNQEVMGKDDFLELLVAQLKAQDPLNPMESTEFTAQLTQFSSLEQLQNINESLDTIRVSQDSQNSVQAVNFVGKSVVASGNSMGVADGKADALYFKLSGEAKEVFVNIHDQAGRFVKSLQPGSLGAGYQTLNWDGRDDQGRSVPDGLYTFEVFAVDGDKGRIDTQTFTTGTITGVSFRYGEARLLAGSREIPLRQVIQVSDTND